MKNPSPIITTPQPTHLGFDAPTRPPKYETGIKQKKLAMSYPEMRKKKVIPWLEQQSHTSLEYRSNKRNCEGKYFSPLAINPVFRDCKPKRRSMVVITTFIKPLTTSPVKKKRIEKMTLKIILDLECQWQLSEKIYTRNIFEKIKKISCHVEKLPQIHKTCESVYLIA